LEFLGDAVIHLLAAELRYRADPTAREGTLTLDRAAMVSTGALAAAARRVGLGRYLRVGKGLDRSGGRDLDSLLANSLEALIGAVYLDRGLVAARKLFTSLAAPAGEVNHKGRLQELTQAMAAGIPEYRVLEASGPPHRRSYRVEAVVGGNRLGEGEGSTLRAAEQAAARQVIEALEHRAR
jgi:ribonuclease-3